MKFQSFFSTLVLTSLALCLHLNAHAAPAVSLDEVRTALETKSTVVVDIREPGEQTAGVAKGALLIPMGQLEKQLPDLLKSKNQPVILICQTQNRSSRFADQLAAAGYTQVSFVKGGMTQWAQQGWPMAKP